MAARSKARDEVIPILDTFLSIAPGVLLLTSGEKDIDDDWPPGMYTRTLKCGALWSTWGAHQGSWSIISKSLKPRCWEFLQSALAEGCQLKPPIHRLSPFATKSLCEEYGRWEVPHLLYHWPSVVLSSSGMSRVAATLKYDTWGTQLNSRNDIFRTEFDRSSFFWRLAQAIFPCCLSHGGSFI